jgi:hypothetical protein
LKIITNGNHSGLTQLVGRVGMGIADVDYHAFLKKWIEEAVSDLNSADVN